MSQLDRELGSADGSKTARPATRKLSKGLSQTAPAAFRPAAEHFGVSSPGSGSRRPSADILKTPRAKPTERIKNVGGGTAAQRQAAARGPTTFSPLVVNLLKQAPSLPFLVGSIQTPKAYVEGGFVITQRGFEQTPSGLEPRSVRAICYATRRLHPESRLRHRLAAAGASRAPGAYCACGHGASDPKHRRAPLARTWAYQPEQDPQPHSPVPNPISAVQCIQACHACRAGGLCRN